MTAKVSSDVHNNVQKNKPRAEKFFRVVAADFGVTKKDGEREKHWERDKKKE